MCSLAELTELKDVCEQYVFDQCMRAYKFEQENTEYVDNHESGDWNVWKFRTVNSIIEPTHQFRHYVEHFNKADFMYCIREAKELTEKLEQYDY